MSSLAANWGVKESGEVGFFIVEGLGKYNNFAYFTHVFKDATKIYGVFSIIFTEVYQYGIIKYYPIH